ncbi:exocyst complex component EXO70E2-like [Silene latifolia]|uniref:exocyst complex component EXO70E2-like n=1 Tax=Silene latifolia TaxID=37657 RepID=UPI003D7897C4
MGDIRMFPSAPMRRESLIAAHNLLKELEANESLTDEMRKILLDIDTKLSKNLSLESETSESVEKSSKEDEFDEVKGKLSTVKEVIMGWESNNAMICESGSEVSDEYINAVQEVSGLVEQLRGMCSEGNEIEESISQAEDVLQIAMARLEEELLYVLVQKRRSYEPFRAEDDGSEGDDVASVEEPGLIDFDLVEPEVVPFLKMVKSTMFAANYDQEFCAAYTRTQKEVLEDCLVGLGMEKNSIDELLKMEWTILDSKIKTWVQMIKTAVHVYLRAEKQLCNQIFGESGPDASLCFVNTAKSSMSCLLIFGHAMSLGPHTPEKLFSLLDMYEALADVREQINALFSAEDGSFVRAEFEEVMERMGDSAKATFLGFGNVILSDPSVDQFPGGGVHPLTSWVMNYITVYLPDYFKTLDTLVQDKSDDPPITPKDSLLGSHLRSLGDKLKSNLEKKSHLYKDVALQNVFMMNNLHYIQNKIMGSELRSIIGDDWIRTQIVSYQQHATSYVRTTWSSVVASLREDGIPSGSGSGVKNFLKEKIRIFSVAFEEVYRNQTGWVIRDEQLKEELRISISQKVILAYQSFIGRHNKYDIEKYVKYDSDELETLLQDFFEGSPKSLHYSRGGRR